jgi:hypothetical protein
MFFFNQNCPIFILKNWELKKNCSVNLTNFAKFLGGKSQNFNIRKIEKKFANAMIMIFSKKKPFLILLAKSTIHKFSRNSTLKHCFFFPQSELTS